jgi:type IV pilus assembly protein PilB
MADVLGHMVGSGLLNQEQAVQVQAHAAAHGGTVARAAVELGYLDREKAREAVAAAHGGTSLIADLASVKCDPDAIALITKVKARMWSVIPIRFEGDTVVLAATAASANSTQVSDDLRLALGRPYRFEIAPDLVLKAMLDAEYRNEREIAALAGQVTDGAKEAPDMAVRMVELTLDQAITDRASDIHIEPGSNEVYVRYRIDGVLIDKPSIPKQIALSVISRLKVMSGMDIAENRVPLDGRMSMTRQGRKIDMRVSSLPTVYGEKIVARILDNSATRQSLKEFAFSEANERRWLNASKKPSGLLLVTGPTGSGKSTTLYATLNELARPEVNIVTVEDPVEYRIPRINQVQVNPKAGLTFSSALRSILRQDPDIILLGEIRDKETAQIAIEASLTGHLVLSTLHTNSAPEAATRLSEMGVDGYLVGSVLECTLAQRLVRRLCLACRRAYEPDPEQLAAVEFYSPDGVTPAFFEPVGCARCSMTGYKGRIAVHETMIRTPALEKAIVKDSTIDIITGIAKTDGMVPMRADGWDKVAQGLTTIAEVLRVVA